MYFFLISGRYIFYTSHGKTSIDSQPSHTETLDGQLEWLFEKPVSSLECVRIPARVGSEGAPTTRGIQPASRDLARDQEELWSGARLGACGHRERGRARDSHWQAPYFRCQQSANGIETQTETEIELVPEDDDAASTLGENMRNPGR